MDNASRNKIETNVGEEIYALFEKWLDAIEDVTDMIDRNMLYSDTFESKLQEVTAYKRLLDLKLEKSIENTATHRLRNLIERVEGGVDEVQRKCIELMKTRDTMCYES